MNHHSEERWKPVVGFEDLYMVSDLGRAKRLVGKGCRYEKLLKPSSWGSGYLRYQLSKNGQPHSHFIHRLVLAAFIGSPMGRQCNHRNGIKTDNRVANLEWVSPSGNAIHRSRILKRASGERHSHAKLSEDDVREIRRIGAMGWQQWKIAYIFSVAQATISDIIIGKTWRYLT